MLFREKTTVYCENRAKHKNTLCARTQSFSVLKKVVHTELLGFKGLMTYLQLYRFYTIKREIENENPTKKNVYVTAVVYLRKYPKFSGEAEEIHKNLSQCSDFWMEGLFRLYILGPPIFPAININCSVFIAVRKINGNQNRTLM
jgi:hypothetical protein